MWSHSRDVPCARLQRILGLWEADVSRRCGRRKQAYSTFCFSLALKTFFSSYTKGVTSNYFCFNFFFLLTLKEWAVSTRKGQGVPSARWPSGAFSSGDGEAVHSGPSGTASRGFQLHKHPWVDSFSKVVLLASRCSYSPDVKLSIVHLLWMLTCASKKDLAGEGTGLQDPFKEREPLVLERLLQASSFLVTKIHHLT